MTKTCDICYDFINKKYFECNKCNNIFCDMCHLYCEICKKMICFDCDNCNCYNFLYKVLPPEIANIIVEKVQYPMPFY